MVNRIEDLMLNYLISIPNSFMSIPEVLKAIIIPLKSVESNSLSFEKEITLITIVIWHLGYSSLKISDSV